MEYASAVAHVLKERKQIANSSSYISLWNKWYKGKVPSFHTYTVFNGQKKIRRERLSMKMAKQVCEDWASLLMNEKVQIVVKDQDILEGLLMNLDFWNKANESVEKGFALSMCAVVINVCGLRLKEVETEQENTKDYVMDEESTKDSYLELSVHSANTLVPITWRNGKCIEAGFVQEDSDRTVVTVHLLNENGTYDIWKHIEYKQPKEGKIQKANEDSKFATGSKIPFFQIIHPRITNNLELDSPYPISIFANSIDTLKAIDMKYDSYNVEFENGKKRTYVSGELNEVDKETGETRNSFDPNDTVIYALPKGASLNGDGKPLIVNVTDTLRSAEHSQAIQDELNFLSKQCGLGVDYYRFEKGRVMTATQVISEKSDTFRNMKKHEGVLEKALIDLMKALMYASNEFTTTKFSDADSVEVHFDDSIIEDKTTEKENDRKDVDSGIMSKLQFRMKWYGEDEETAKKMLKDAFGDTNLTSKISAYAPLLASGGMSVEEYVNQVYDYLSDEDKAKMVEALQRANTITTESLGI